MEQKLERMQLRKAFNRMVNSLQLKFKNEESGIFDVVTTFKLLEDKADRLFRMDELAKDDYVNISVYLKEEEIIKDLEEMESYREKWLTMKSSYGIYLIENDAHHIDSLISESFDTDSSSIKLPAFNVKKFDGNLTNWIGFWAHFQRIHEDDTIDAKDKFEYLVHATVKGTRAREVVESFPQTSENYDKVIERLKSRFGNENLLIEAYIKEILLIVIQNTTSTDDYIPLWTIYDNLETQIHALEILNVTTDKFASMLYPLVESCLNEDTLRSWQRSRKFNQKKDSQSKLENLMIFLESKVDAEDKYRLSSAYNEHNFNKQERTDAGRFLSWI